MESKKIKPKIKIINIGKDEIKLKDENLIDMIKKQNTIDEKGEGFYMRVMKKIIKEKKEGNTRTKGADKEGMIILEVNERTHELMLRRGKINIGWRKCPIFKHYSVRRCFRCWGYYYIAINCTLMARNMP